MAHSDGATNKTKKSQSTNRLAWVFEDVFFYNIIIAQCEKFSVHKKVIIDVDKSKMINCGH